MKNSNAFNSTVFSSLAPYSTAYEAGGIIFFSGQLPLDPKSKKVINDHIRVTAQRTLDNIGLLLEEAGLQKENIIKCTVFLIDMNDFAAFNEVYGKFFDTHKPARSCIAVKELPLGANVEIEITACR